MGETYFYNREMTDLNTIKKHSFTVIIGQHRPKRPCLDRAHKKHIKAQIRHKKTIRNTTLKSL